MGGKRTLPLTLQTAKYRRMMQWPVLAVAVLVVVGGCGQRPGSDNLLESGATYARSCSVALSGWMRPGDSPGEYPLWHHLVRNRVEIAGDNSLRWNGDPVTRSALRVYLARTADLNPPMAVVLRADGGADCQIVRTIRRDIEELVRCQSSRLCGEGDGEWD